MHDLLPIEAFGQDTEKWDDILNRVRQFMKRTGRVGWQKLERFQATEVPDDFVSRQLNDTRFTTSFAADYLACLYGGRWDESSRLRIQASTGGITAHLRNEWRLNSILGGGEKTRDDHRHHAVDAVAIALTSPRTQTMLQEAASRAAVRHERRPFAEVEEPWSDFLPQVREVILAIDGVRQAVSHRVNHKLAGPLHADTLYSPPIKHADDSTAHHVRKALHKLSLTEVTGDKIVDPVIRTLVQQQFERLRASGLKDPPKAFAEPGNHPYLTTKKGGLIPIHKVRLVFEKKARKIAERNPHRLRYVASTDGSNHHTVIIAKLDAAGNEVKWEQRLVTRLDAYQRLRDRKKSGSGGADIIQRDWGKDYRFKFFLMARDCVEMDDSNGGREIYRVCKISQTASQNEIQFQEHNDARKPGDARSSSNRITSIDNMRKRHACKVRISPLGEILPDEPEKTQ
jgi:CRISPR-associated endonuclease Csn1